MMAFLKLLFRNKLAAMGAVVLSIIVLLVILTPILPLQNPDITATADRFKRPFTDGHLLGTDHLGRDLLGQPLPGVRAPAERYAVHPGDLFRRVQCLGTLFLGCHA